VTDDSLKAFARSFGVHRLPKLNCSIGTATDENVQAFDTSEDQFSYIALYKCTLHILSCLPYAFMKGRAVHLHAQFSLVITESCDLGVSSYRNKFYRL